MPQSLSKIYVHITFHIKNHQVYIRKDDKEKLYAYMNTIVKDTGSVPIKINGTDDHVHIFCALSRNMSIAKLTEDIKRHSSRWIKMLSPHYSLFSWQGGYAAFSVSQSLKNKTIKYIENQENHHRKMTFKDELRAFLNEYEVKYDEQYLFDEQY